MGRCNTSFYDDLLLQKTKAIVCQVLDNLNEHDEIDHIQALSSQETNARFSDVQGLNPTDIAAITKSRKKVTFEQFVENLDGQNQFVKNLTEILVSETLRNAIQKSIIDPALIKQWRETNVPSLLRSEEEWQRNCEESRTLHLAVDKLTKAFRRSDSWVEGESSSSSSSSSESDLTVTPFDVVTLGTVPRAPPSVLQQGRDGGETTRTTREDRNAMLSSGTAARSRRLELITQHPNRRRLSRLGQRQLNDVARARRHRTALEGLQSARRDADVGRRPSDSLLNETPSLSSNQDDDDPTANLVHRFLTQPFPSEARTNGRRGPSNSSSDANEIDLLTSIYGDQEEDHLPPPTHVDPIDIRLPVVHAEEPSSSSSYQRRIRPSTLLGTESRNETSRIGEFEAFANSRRSHRRPQDSTNGVDGANVDSPVEERETFYRALDTLFRADETIRQVSRDTTEEEGASETGREARRFTLSVMSDSRPVVRLPNRTPREREGREE